MRFRKLWSSFALKKPWHPFALIFVLVPDKFVAYFFLLTIQFLILIGMVFMLRHLECCLT